MAKTIPGGQKKTPRGRPPAGFGPVIGIRLPPSLIKAIDAWAAHETAGSRSEAMRRLLEAGLSHSQPEKRRSPAAAAKAADLAGKQIDKFTDASAPPKNNRSANGGSSRGPENLEISAGCPNRKVDSA
jgi:Arc/MetJ-type ribon-helix-helix transcriptional regulator